ncbi:MAG TPA: NADH-quinone oxidoreductase subunit NuoB [Bdellovibrionales bacterium]|nr:NADH-quinone oxidoreductase subunit NuoB [Bdellovibrionales bacterium]
MALFSSIGKSIEGQIERHIIVPWPLAYGCCRIEIENTMSATYDWQRLGVGRLVEKPHQADTLIVSGWINEALAEEIKAVYAQLAAPRSVIAVGACMLSGSPYATSPKKALTISELIPVDVFVPGCPPRPEAILEAFNMLKQIRNPMKNQDKVIYAALRGPSGA